MDAPAARRVLSDLLAVLIATPAIAAAIGLAALEGYRVVSPASPAFGEPPPKSLADAITGGYGVEHAYGFIRAGQDPSEPIGVDDSDYTGGRSIRVSPLMLAVAARDANVVAMLVSFGARLDLPQNRHAPCLAQELRDETIAEILARSGGAPPSSCTGRRQDASTPLAAWSQ